MERFQPGEQVLVRRFMGSWYDPPRCAVVRCVYGARSMLYDYLVEVDSQEYPVRHDWLVPMTITIHEDVELSDVGLETVG